MKWLQYEGTIRKTETWLVNSEMETCFFFFFITLKPRVEWCTKSMRLKYEPASEPLHISMK